MVSIPYDQFVDDWLIKAALGYWPDVITIHKFGDNPSVGTTEEDIWLVGGDQTHLTEGTALYASCTDNTNGQGQVLRVQGTDENWDYQSTTVTLTGQTQALLGPPGTLWTSFWRGYQISASPDPVGDVWIAESDTLTGVRA